MENFKDRSRTEERDFSKDEKYESKNSKDVDPASIEEVKSESIDFLLDAF